ncbi:hypothetical protein CR194_10615 [Salipaludibacillus keqinensis]|uniref:DUF1516 domain-containing protein n=1 Tax=Salipaludibacillus keqinensis TaxID=2045207 RepID=A0A323THA4_9BACI|nr:YisL family protein [Salipaludibacillus keqinensis]PYZ93606.1 hypothetical protein CR194_10615 [Salipaludibacillus keqinensis]
MWQYETFIHSHALFWFITMVLFGLTVVFLKTGKRKPAKIIQMTLRVFYILLFVTGGGLIIMNLWWGTVVKGLLAFWLIYVMELISNRMSKNELTVRTSILFWIQFIVSFLAVLYFGYFV